MDIEYVAYREKEAARKFLQFVNENYVVFREKEVVWNDDLQTTNESEVFTNKDGEYDFDAVYNEFKKQNK